MTSERQSLTREDLVHDLRRLGVEPGMTVLVHSSLSSLGWVEGGAETVIDALLEAVGPEGTVLVPTLTGTEEDGPEHPPRFDPATSPCWTGTIPETFRRREAAERSMHPTHSVAGIGNDTRTLIEGHAHVATPCAADSPYGRLADRGGRILLLGVTHESNTCLHMVEEQAHAPYHMQPEPCPCYIKREDGTWEEVVTGLHLWRWDRNFPKIDPLLTAAGAQKTGRVGQAESRLVDVGAMRDLLLPILGDDPLFLLSDEARAEYGSTAPV
ncbi:MAG TPA: AAC(3) family N-acetyltransferase [Chloroflexota bacterium]|nr:AAC(3) family N-acetyltransferase [Chloroflexota bacterium]